MDHQEDLPRWAERLIEAIHRVPQPSPRVLAISTRLRLATYVFVALLFVRLTFKSLT